MPRRRSFTSTAGSVKPTSWWFVYASREQACISPDLLFLWRRQMRTNKRDASVDWTEEAVLAWGHLNRGHADLGRAPGP